MLRYFTAGESHGKGLLALLDGFPAGMTVDEDQINAALRLRQGGYGRGGRQAIETDTVEVLTGVRNGVTMGSPVALWVKNKDFKLPTMPEIDRPRPGHGDLAGAMKYLNGVRNILERSSARETAAKVAAGAFCRQLLEIVGIHTLGYVNSIGTVFLGPKDDAWKYLSPENGSDQPSDLETLRQWRNESPLYSLSDKQSVVNACALIDKMKAEGDTIGGDIVVHVSGLPFGLGTHAQWLDKLDGRLAQIVMSVQAIKAVEIGGGYSCSALPGSQVHDPIHFNPNLVHSSCLGWTRPQNRAGGLEAGMTNSQDIVICAAMKPIPTLRRPLDSVSFSTKQPTEAVFERSDVCAVPAAAIVLESVVAIEITSALIDKFGGDSVEELTERVKLFNELARKQ